MVFTYIVLFPLAFTYCHSESPPLKIVLQTSPGCLLRISKVRTLEEPHYPEYCWEAGEEPHYPEYCWEADEEPHYPEYCLVAGESHSAFRTCPALSQVSVSLVSILFPAGMRES